MTVVRVRALGRRFNATRVLRDLNLEMTEGERVAVCGANGAGKTTLLRSVAGLLRPSEGTIEVLGGTPDNPRVRGRIGLLGHDPFLYPRLTALENLKLWGRLYEASDRGRDLLERVGLDPDDRRHVVTYSHGMRRRAGLARALLHEPDLLILDEPFAGLDADGAAVVTELIREARTVLFATHERERADALGARVVVLRDGAIHAS